jgi:hypothetical protein
MTGEDPGGAVMYPFAGIHYPVFVIPWQAALLT